MTTELQDAAVELQQSEAKRAELLPDEVENAIQNTLRTVDVGAHSYHMPIEWAIDCERDMETLRAHIAAQSSEIERIRVALEWIAYTECLVYECQEKARAALAQGAKK